MYQGEPEHVVNEKMELSRLVRKYPVEAMHNLTVVAMLNYLGAINGLEIEARAVPLKKMQVAVLTGISTWDNDKTEE